MTQPVKPTPRPEKATFIQFLRAFHRDILSSLPDKLYRAWMAEFRTIFFKSVLINDPELVKLVLKNRPQDFPKSDAIGEGLRPLLGQSVFLTNGETWERQRRIINPAFEGGRLRDVYPQIFDAAGDMVERIKVGQRVEVEEISSYAAADVIFRTLFSIPITSDIAGAVFREFKTYQRSQPILNLGAFLPMPKWMPRFHKPATKQSAANIRQHIIELTKERANLIARQVAPNDLATKIMTTRDPQTNSCFEWDEMVDQVAIFFLAGHETSASALAWSLYLLASYPEWQEILAREADGLSEEFSTVSNLKQTRAVFREALRLYPPVPMMVRETTKPECWRERHYDPGLNAVISPWHLHRHQKLWDNPDGFDPDRWESENGKECMRNAFIPFSAGPRVCPGAGFAMIEGVVLLARLMQTFRVSIAPDDDPIPVAHLTVRAENGIWLRFERRS